MARDKIFQIKRSESAQNRANCLGAFDSFHRGYYLAGLRLDGANNSILNQQHKY